MTLELTDLAKNPSKSAKSSIKILIQKHFVIFNLTPVTPSFFILIIRAIQSRLCCSNIKVNNMEPTRSPLLPAPFAVPAIQAFAQEPCQHAA
nr:hypothetical protein [uncultured Pseudomonas sp.]